MKLLLQQPDYTTIKGRRDLALLSLLYDTGARVQEIIDLTPSMLRLDTPPVIKIIGKGNRARIVPMLDAQTGHLKNYILENRLDTASANMYPLFFNSRKEKLTRAGIHYIVQKYFKKALEENKMLLPEKISCHSLRHSKAMHLLQAGVNLVYIRDILGHVSVQTTEIYARADSKQKRKALEKAYVNVNPNETAKWTKNESLMMWLKKF
jgi:site-specific recombinase XerD